MDISAWTDSRRGKSWLNKRTTENTWYFCRFCSERGIKYAVEGGDQLVELSYGSGENNLFRIKGITFGSAWSVMAASKFWKERKCQNS
jgi:hypothetical protein